MNYDKMKQKELRAGCKQAGIKYGKMSIAQMQEALRSQKFVWHKGDLENLVSKANGQTKPTTKKSKPGAKQVLRDKFTQHGVVTVGQIDRIAATLSVTRATVMTAMSDLKNAKYAGQAGPLNIEKDGDAFRLAN